MILRKLWLAAILLLTLSACGLSGKENQEVRLQKALEPYQKPALTTEAVITENLGEKTQIYTISFQKADGQQDHLTILQPESVSGVSFTVSAQESMEISYEDTVLQTGLSELTGITPADAVSVLLREMAERLPTEYWTEQTEDGECLAFSITDELDGKKIRKDVFLEPKTSALRHADIYVDENCVMQLDFKNFTWNT